MGDQTRLSQTIDVVSSFSPQGEKMSTDGTMFSKLIVSLDERKEIPLSDMRNSQKFDVERFSPAQKKAMPVEVVRTVEKPKRNRSAYNFFFYTGTRKNSS